MKQILILIMTIGLFSCNQSNSSSSSGATFDSSGYTLEDVGNGVTHVTKMGTNGELKEEGFLLNNQKTGQWLTYGKEGKILHSTNYLNGSKYGKDVSYSTIGNIAESVTYENDVRQGLHQKYEGRRISEEVTYNKGEIDGTYKQYFNNKLQKEAEFKNGVQDGKLTYYDDDGNVTMQYIYKDGKKVSGGVVE